MKAPFKLIFISLLFLTSTTCLKAQEKYDYAVVKYSIATGLNGKATLSVSISGKEFEKTEIKESVKMNEYTPLVNYVQKMSNDGWRVINTISDGLTFSFILEKKKN